MTPDPEMFASAPTSRTAAPTGRRHKSSHHRGKTAKSKKKKLWTHFSPWDATKDSDCEDEDLVYFCRSRGITKSPTAAASAPAARAQTTNQPSNDRNFYRQKQRQTTALPTQPQRGKVNMENSGAGVKPEAIASESRAPASLCASLKDKSKFVRESRAAINGWVENGEAPSKKDEEQATQVLIKQRDKDLPPGRQDPERNDADAESSTTTTEDNSSQHSGSSLPKLPGNVVNCGSSFHSQATQNKGATSLSRASGEFHRQGTARKASKEWSADVETEIMRLYENSGPGSGLSILETKSNAARSGYKLKDQVNSKLNNTEHTPSYVLALANLFRRRMQIRKEFSQISGDAAEGSFKPSLPGSYSITNAFPAPKNAHRPCSHNPHAPSEEESTPVSLRYHHVTTLNGTSAIQQTAPHVTVAKPGSVTFCSFATPLNTGASTPTTRRKADKATEADCNTEDAGKNRSEVDKPVLETVYPAATSSALSAKAQSESLETLLTVFPKPPQLKFASVAEGGVVKRHTSNVAEIQKTMNEMPQREKVDSASTTSLIMSVAASRKKEPKVMLPSKENDDSVLNSKPVRRTSEHKPLKPLGASRKCRSADGKQQESSEHFKQQRCFDIAELPPRKRVREFLLFDKHAAKSQSTDETSNLPAAAAKVRWSGSLGTLYPKPKILGDTVRCAAQADAISPRLMVDRLMSLCDVTLARTGNGKVKIPTECQPQSELMTVSPIDKQKSAVAS